MKILVIDDEKPTLSMFKLFLTAYGYDVYTAEDGEKGLALFDEISPEIVFTDIKMPGIDGLQVLRR
ncbi:MAG: response regulator, partial [Deltaproteobacteria bacterium]|nr:response regulator [Deltaproteobacteria bacterium]